MYFDLSLGFTRKSLIDCYAFVIALKIFFMLFNGYVPPVTVLISAAFSLALFVIWSSFFEPLWPLVKKDPQDVIDDRDDDLYK